MDRRTGAWHIPCEFTDDLTSKDFYFDIEDADYIEGVECFLCSMGEMIRNGWKFHFELFELVGTSPSGYKVSCMFGEDNVLRILHKVPTWKEAEALPVPEGDYSTCISSVSNSHEAAMGKWLHGLFKHSNSDKIWRPWG